MRKVEPTPVPVPATKPKIEVLNVDGRVITLRLSDVLKPLSKAKPAGTAGASLFSFVGEVPPADVQAWTFEGNVTKPSEIPLTVDQSLTPGTKVWLTAFWYSRRAVSGPAANPVSTQIQFGGLIVSNVKLTNTTRRKAA